LNLGGLDAAVAIAALSLYAYRKAWEYLMSETGGWCVTVKDGDQMRLFMVASKDAEVAKKMALRSAGAGDVTEWAEISDDEISAMNMQPDEVKESREIGRG
jgi:hypothetical protein